MNSISLKVPFLIVVCIFLFSINVFLWSIVYSEDSREFLTVIYLDVGQGDATLIEAPNGNRMLIDSGPGSIIIDALFKHIPFYDRSIDVVISTHPHADHIGGLVDILEYFDVGVVLDSGVNYDSQTYQEYLLALEENQIDKIYAQRGMVVVLDDEVWVPILFPDRNVQSLNADMASIWSRVVYRDTSFLFTGDSFEGIESYLASIDGDRLKSDVFQAGHHGSRTSNSLLFLATVLPDYFVVSAGLDNRFGHPHPEVVERVDYIGSQMLSTFNKGDIVFISDGETIKLKY